MRNSFLWVLHGAISVLALSLCSAPLLTAQVGSPAKRTHVKRSMSRGMSRANPLRKGKSQRSLPVIAEVPLNAPEQSPAERQITSAAPATDSYHSPVNLRLLLPPTQASFGQMEEKRETQSRASQFADVPEAREPNAHGNDPEYYARHVPVVGGLVCHVLEQSKAHPHVTRVFQVIHPEF